MGAPYNQLGRYTEAYPTAVMSILCECIFLCSYWLNRVVWLIHRKEASRDPAASTGRDCSHVIANVNVEMAASC